MAKLGLLMSQLLSLYLCFLSVRFKPVRSSHVVGWATFNFVSHTRVLWRLGQELQARGHKYTQVLPSCAKEIYDDVNVILFNTSITNEEIEDISFDLMKCGSINSISGAVKAVMTASSYRSMLKRFCEDFFGHKSLIDELKKSADLLLCDFTNACCSILADMLNVTRVDVSSIGFGGHAGAFMFGNPQALVYLTLEYESEPSNSAKFSLPNRLVTFVIYTTYRLIIKILVQDDLWDIYAKSNSRFTSATDAARIRGIGLIPHDFTLEYSRPLGANVKAIGPILPEPARKLPNYLNEFMTINDKVVLVSFGTSLSKFPLDLAKVIADGLSKLSGISVLWKHSGGIPNTVGDNIKIVPWIPQNESSINDILGHPSTKVFVTHGGLNSLQESVYHSVPMVVVPLFFDHLRHARIVKMKGLGVSLDTYSMKSEDLTKAILEVLDNRMYNENAKKISALLKDRKRTPRQEGADWIEYALRHDGARHLTSEAFDLPEYQLYMFDVFLVVLFVIFATCFISLRLCRFVWGGKTEISAKWKKA